MKTFIITTTETHVSTYKVIAATKKDALEIFEAAEEITDEPSQGVQYLNTEFLEVIPFSTIIEEE